jgi:uncharacterized protein with HEPN domain
VTRDLSLYIEDILASIERIEEYTRVLIHQYFGVNLHRTWLIVTEDIPVLKSKLTRLYNDMQGDNGEAG